MNYEQLAKQFWEQGYLIFENFFEDEIMDQFNQQILDYFGESPEFFHNEEFLEKAKTEVIPWFPQWEGVKEFDYFDNHEHLVGLTKAILGEGWEALYSMVMFSKSGTKGQSWHQDCPPEDPKLFNINRLSYTMDVTEDIGGYTLVVPKSHKAGVLPASEENDTFYEDQVVIKPRKGTLVLLHGHAWHRVEPVIGKYRISTNCRAIPAGVPKDVTDICVYPNMRYSFKTNEVIEDRLANA
ncbi:hypothetical protein GCM10011369_20890 [Neiella marina]|uniref:Phytanoyl-CoA dioxygenase n=1 Tax=Neiella marina TaxID=508461 RepID=A0A8J2XPB3_9GAMM|nr:phytanoyl-CoA dioxygenase family protein [Neiella marina]GGA78772.1 hypothetical protein GCM10011369_20890 [Neiella marina]